MPAFLPPKPRGSTTSAHAETRPRPGGTVESDVSPVGPGEAPRGSETPVGVATAARPAATPTAAEATRRAYGADWARFGRWCRLRGASPLPPDPALIGLYLADCVAPAGPSPALSLASIERALAGIGWGYRQRGLTLDRADRRVADVLAGLRQGHAAPPVRKAAVSARDVLAMVATLPFDLRGLRDRALLLLGFAAGTRRSELVGLDRTRGGTPDGIGWVEIEDGGAVLTLRGKTGWREVEVGRGSSDRSCPVVALETWLEFGRVESGAVFRRVSQDGARALDARLSDKHVARLVKATVRAAGLRPDLPEAERLALYSGHSLRMGLSNQPEADATQRHLGQAPSQAAPSDLRPRERFKVNLTLAAGL